MTPRARIATSEEEEAMGMASKGKAGEKVERLASAADMAGRGTVPERRAEEPRLVCFEEVKKRSRVVGCDKFGRGRTRSLIFVARCLSL